MRAVCVLRAQTTGDAVGTVTFVERDGGTEVVATVRSRAVGAGAHGLHIHRLGDVRQGCASVCDHFNPHGQPHGDRADPLRTKHAGDLGNIIVAATGRGTVRFFTRELRVNPRSHLSVLGRSVVLHALPDDLGRQPTRDSRTTGSSGPRVACGVIGWAA